MKSRILINDGQHRRAAIEAALRENPDLGDEAISVVFFIDVGLKRSQQMFADLNRYAIRPTTSLGLLYDHRNENALIAKGVMEQVPVFNGLTEMERSSISNRSIKLFTLSGINNATQALLSGLSFKTFQDKLELAVAFWIEVSRHIPDWQLVKEGKVSPGDLRRDTIHAHALALAALARVGNTLQIRYGATWEKRLDRLDSIDWSRANTKWEGRALTAGRLSKRSINIKLTANLIKKRLRIPLSEEEKILESDLKR